VKIFIPFIPGTLQYDCGQCQSSCCKYGILALTNNEWKNAEKNKHFIKYFTVGFDKSIHAISKYSRCWFLEENGLCSIEKKFGYKKKPLFCKAFPFKVVKCGEEYFINVAITCPTLTVSHCSGKSRSDILKNANKIVATGIARKIKIHPFRLLLEKKIFRRMKYNQANPSYLKFLSEQIQITKDKSYHNAEAKMTKMIYLWLRFLNLKANDLYNPKISFELTSITCILRLLAYRFNEHVILNVLAALYLFILVYDKSMGSSDKPIPLYTYISMIDLASGLAQIGNNKKTCQNLKNFLSLHNNDRVKLMVDFEEMADKYLSSVEQRLIFIRHLTGNSPNLLEEQLLI